MKTLKVSIILLAFLLAAMVMVPMVNAKEQATTGANAQLPHLQPDDTQQKTVIHNGFSLSNGDNMTALPEGAIIQHSIDGVTRVFDSNGKQLSVSNDVDSPKIPTPNGYIVADMINHIPNGALVQDNDNGTANVYLNNQRILTVLSPPTHETITANAAYAGGHIEYGWVPSVPTLSQFNAFWQVPATPTNNQTGATDFLYTGIEPPSKQDIVQPLLFYQNQEWNAYAYYVDSSGGAFEGDRLYPAENDMMEGTLEWNPSLNAWQIMITDDNTVQTSSVFSVSAPDIGTTDDAVYCALEAYNFNNNNDLPGTTTFEDMTAWDTNYHLIYFTWSTWQSTNYGLSNLGVTANGMNYVTLST